MTSQLRKVIMKRYRLKNKSNKSANSANIIAYKAQRDLVVKLNKEDKKKFLKIQITENAASKTKKHWKLCKIFFPKKGLHYKQKFTLKTKRGVAPSETTTANIFNNYYVNITKSLNTPA